MKPTHSPDAPDFEETARHLLERYAEGMPSEASVEARVRAQIAAQEPRRNTARQRTAPRWPLDGWARGAVSLALVIVLVAGFAAVLHGRQSTAPGKTKTGVSKATCPTVGAQGVITLCAGQHVQVAITLGQAYADATRTEVETHLKLTGDDLRINGSSSLTPASKALHATMTLQDSQGRLYGPSDFSRNFINYVQDMPQTVDGATIAGASNPPPGFAAFDPLPESMIGSPQTLTLHISDIDLLYYTPQYSWVQSTLILKGPWALTFQVTPQAGRSITFNVAPQTYSGITVQPLRLDIGGKGNDFDYLGQGERLILRVSGLAPDTRRSTVANIDFKYFDSLGAGDAAGGPNAKNQLLFEGQLPATVAGMAHQPLAVDPEVGPTGTIDLEVIFLRLPHLTGVQTLTLNQLAVAFDGSQFTDARGNWSFQLPLG